jgi:hypothetical protein
MRKWLIVGSTFVFTLVAVTGLTLADENSDTIKKVMKAAMKGPLVKAVASGKADEDQKKELLVLLKDLAKAKPPKGTEEDWKKRTTALVDGAEEAIDGKGGASLKKAADCKGCHTAHKGK